jgi:hypothetical protein
MSLAVARGVVRTTMISVEGNERASLCRADGYQHLVWCPTEILHLGSGHVVASIDEKPASTRTEIRVQLELHDA